MIFWPTQNASDYDYLQVLAANHGFVFYVRPGPLPNTNIPYWGPAMPLDAVALAQMRPALTVNTGPQSNVNWVSFTYDALASEMVLGETVEPNSNVPVPVIMPPISTDVPLALVPAAVNQGLRTRVSRPGPPTESERKTALEEAREAVKTLCEPVEPPRDTAAYVRYFCARESGNAEQLKENEPKRVALYKLAAAYLRAFANLANEMQETGYTDAEVEAIKSCPNCNRRVDEEWIICPSCRTRLNRVCPNCGRLVGLDWTLCAWCGRDFDRRGVAAAVRSLPALGERDAPPPAMLRQGIRAAQVPHASPAATARKPAPDPQPEH